VCFLQTDEGRRLVLILEAGGLPNHVDYVPSRLKFWKESFFYINVGVFPNTMTFRDIKEKFKDDPPLRLHINIPFTLICTKLLPISRRFWRTLKLRLVLAADGTLPDVVQCSASKIKVKFTDLPKLSCTHPVKGTVSNILICFL
jgi:hypothetical protein